MTQINYNGQVLEIKGYHKNYNLNLGNFFPTSKGRIKRLVELIYETETDVDTASGYIDSLREWLSQEIFAFDDRLMSCEMEVTKYHNLGKGNQAWTRLKGYRDKEYQYLEKLVEDFRKNRILIGNEAVKHGWPGKVEEVK